MQEYVALNGGVNKFLHKGREYSNAVIANLQFEEGKNSYSFLLAPGENTFFFKSENLGYRGSTINISNLNTEADVKNNVAYRADYIRYHLVSQFQPEDIVTIDMENGESQFRRLSSEDFSLWIEEYSLGDLWRRKIIPHGQP